MRRLSWGIFLVSLITLSTELALTRVFDAILTTGMAYMVITCAMFAFGLAGIVASLRPFPDGKNLRDVLAVLAGLVALFALAILPVSNALALDHDRTVASPFAAIVTSLAGLYLCLIIPFFLAGLILTYVFSANARQIQTLYFWDLAGAALGCVAIIPFLPLIGPGGLLLCAAGLGLFASALFSTRRPWSILAVVLGGLVISLPFAHMPAYYDFKEIIPKRDVKRQKERGNFPEYTHWDRISKIDVINLKDGAVKHIAYDGGSQSSHIFKFDGNFKKLRQNVYRDTSKHFWNRAVLASHYLKRDSAADVLIIGSAGGQEVKAALLYGAGHVDGVELVKAVVDIGKGRYATYNGNLLNHPRVSVRAGEGRSFLRASDKRYDILQIFSNHTSSSIAAGNGAVATTYLNTAEAFQEYFAHLTENGVLQINHHIYPRLVVTAALAWRQMGRSEFSRHVVVFDKVQSYDDLPTLLIKMTPWTATELKELKEFFLELPFEDGYTYRLVEDPLTPEAHFLSEDFYSGKLPRDLVSRMEYRIAPSTDDRPYFKFLRKKMRRVEPNAEGFLNQSTADLLNSQIDELNITLPLGVAISMDILHLFVTGFASLVFICAFILVPLRFSSVGRQGWSNKVPSLIYFSCLGAGFIIVELVFTQLFLKLIGFPLYTFATVIFVLLLAAALGSYSSARLLLLERNRWRWPFMCVIAMGLFIGLCNAMIFHRFLASAIWVRIAVAAVLIFPLGFFLGMPFPLGIRLLEKQPKGAIAWAWGLNALFTVVGGYASVLLSIYLGFRMTLIIALSLYALASTMFSRMRTGSEYSKV